MNNIPLYSVALTEDSDGIHCISFVDEPAMQVEMLCFNKQHKIDFQINETEQCITSVVILCDTPIYRYDTRIGEYYITFSKDVIKEIAERFNKNGMNNIISLNHDGNEIHDKAVLREIFIKDTDKGISPTDERFKDVPEGSLFATYHLLDTELFNLIKTKGGISMELLSDIKLQKDFNDVDIFDYLFAEDNNEKKKFSKVSEIEELLQSKVKLNILVGDETISNVQFYQVGENAIGEDIVVVYETDSFNWEVIKIKEIKEIIKTETPIENFKFNAKWKLIVEDLNLVIKSTQPTTQKDKNNIDYIMDRNMYVMISYNDETEDSANGYRTCFLSSWGYTTKGNECIRIYEYNGDSKSGFNEGRWRILLTRRITDLKAVEYTNPINTAPPLYNGEAKADTGIWGTMSNVKRVAEFPPKIIWQPEK